jgi:hypothetical protein
MKRSEFDHVIRAAADIVDDELIVIGSQAVLAEHPDAPQELLRSAEVDLYPKGDPSRAIEIDGAIGDGSRFHETYAYYGHGVGPETFTAPAGWEERLVRVELRPHQRRKPAAVAWCLSTGDLLLAKMAAGRPHDFEFVKAAVRGGLSSVEELRRGIDLMPAEYRDRVTSNLDLVEAGVGQQ